MPFKNKLPTIFSTEITPSAIYRYFEKSLYLFSVYCIAKNILLSMEHDSIVPQTSLDEWSWMAQRDKTCKTLDTQAVLNVGVILIVVCGLCPY